MRKKLDQLQKKLEGELHQDELMKKLYATDASAYREMPLAVAIPKSKDDLKLLIEFANRNNTSLIPRAAGTSLAGQVVGNGIVVDISQHFNQIVEVNKEEGWVRVQPGVIRDDLNRHLRNYGLFFAPETSTANRAMIGGMIGNNSCGSNSVVYGSTREHLISVEAFLSDGSEATFGKVSFSEFESKGAISNHNVIERNVYKHLKDILSDSAVRDEIDAQYPKQSIPRRNTGYALDLLKDSEPFSDSKEAFNFCKLIAGSEGTLTFITEAKLSLSPLPPSEGALVAAHFESIDDALRANLIALQFSPSACELMDHYILECTKENIEQRKNRFFVQGDPAALLVVEIRRDTLAEVEKVCSTLIEAYKEAALGYHYPVVKGEDVSKVWTLRKAGLGLLSNIPGDAKAVPVVEDTAVDVNDLPAYIREFNDILKKHGLYSVHYAHAGSGELHLRPIIDLKTQEGNRLFRVIAEEIATLVKKYKGSLSGEHGDGRLRGEFIAQMVGEKNYQLFKDIKKTWDPKGVFNPGKIVDTVKMNEFLRYKPGQAVQEPKTSFDFSSTQGLLKAAEKCNGSGDCRKTALSGGTMCPSYMATREEKDTTRARANILREVLTNSEKKNPFDSEEIKEVMDLCLSCKGCKSECPSNVDMAKLKAEFLQNYYDANGVPLRTKMIAAFNSMNTFASYVPWAYNFMFDSGIAPMIKNMLGFSPKRSMPLMGKTTLARWYKKNKANNFGVKQNFRNGKVYMFCDEFTNFHDVGVGQKAIKLLARLGYEVVIPRHEESGRTYLSKGLVKAAKKIAKVNIETLTEEMEEGIPMIGLEPSAILTFRDEYLDLSVGAIREKAIVLAGRTFMIDEFLANEMDEGKINSSKFTSEKQLIKLHGHCHQKALGSLTPTKKMLCCPENYELHLIPSGCCGMAGSFGYEKEHYEVSMNIGELVLFPTVRMQPAEVIIAAPGTSCRHQISDGTGRKSKHPVEILYEALIPE